MLVCMMWNSFKKISVFNYSSLVLESPDSLGTLDFHDTPDSYDNDGKEDDNSILSTDGLAAIVVALFPESVFLFLLVPSIFLPSN